MAYNKVVYNNNTLIDLTSDTVTADKLMEGYTAHDKSGALITGTATGGGSVTQDQDGFIVLPPDGGGSPSGGGLVYETGTWTPSEDVATYVIPFANTHTEPPFFYIVSDATGTYSSTTYTGYATWFVDWGHLFGVPMYEGESTPKYSEYRTRYKGSSDSFGGGGATIAFPYTETTSSSASYPRYFATETGIRAYTSSTTRYWRAGRTYKWIAVWSPTT